MIPAPRQQLPRGIRNHNPGNIDKVKGVRWQGQAEDQSGDPRFVVFESPKWGIRAIARILITYQDGRRAKDGSRIDTVREIVERWAPPCENQTLDYVNHVAHIAMIGPDSILDVYDFATMKALVTAIIIHENGGNPYPDATIDTGLRLAGIEPPKTRLIKQTDVAATTVAGASALGLLATIAETTTTAIPTAATSAQTADRLKPGIALWLFPTLILLAVIVALAKQLRDRNRDAR